MGTAPPAFITTWETTAVGESITIPVGGATGTYTIDWGDENISVDVSGDQTHTYDAAGTYTVSISGDFTRIYLNGNTTNAPKLVSIEQWGDIRWTTMAHAFQGARNMVYNATDSPDLSGVADMSNMFYSNHRFNGSLSSWDVSGVTNMGSMFAFAFDFSRDISDWNTGNVTDMGDMFQSASSFDHKPLGDWDVSGVTNMNSMFHGASSFNRPLGDWDVSGVTDMNGMFRDASSFDQPLGDWNVSGVTNMNSMFHGASPFNRPLGDWNVSGVTNMNSMFHGASSFNRPLGDWNVSSVTNMDSMFFDASLFNQTLNAWNVSSVTGMDSMFSGASSFNRPLGDWDVSGVTRMVAMFLSATSFNQPLDDWDVSGVTDMGSMFLLATSFNQPLDDWDVSGVTNMGNMFTFANSFNRPLGSWYVVPNSTEIERSAIPGVVGSISAQNRFLDGQNPAYSIASGSDSDHFEISGGNLLNMTSDDAGQDEYTITVVTSDPNLFGSNNRQAVVITVTGQADTAPPAFITTWETTAADESITIPGSGHVHRQLGRRDRPRGRHRLRGARVRLPREPHGSHIRRPYGNHPRRQRDKRGKTAVDRPVGRHRVDLDARCVPGRHRHDIRRGRRPGPLGR